MVSVMATGSAVFGSCAGEINVSVKLKNAAVFPCCGWKYLRLFCGGKAAEDWRWRWVMVSGIGGRLGLFEGYGRIKSP